MAGLMYEQIDRETDNDGSDDGLEPMRDDDDDDDEEEEEEDEDD